MLWTQFIICAVLILISGYKLSDYAHIISKKGIFSVGLMGVLFLSVITSCPEIFTALGSITIVTAPDLATGDLVGSVIINLIAVAAFAFFYKKGAVLNGQSKTNVLTAALTILMLGLIIGFISLRAFFDLRLGVFNIGFDSIVLGLIYVMGIAVIYNRETGAGKAREKGKTGMWLWIRFSIASAVIITCGFWLAAIGKSIADFYGWNEMMIGLVLIAFTTSLPEFVVSLSAVKMGAHEMAVGNILGSNFFNLFIIIILDIFFREGQFLSFVSVSNIYPAFLAIILSFFVLAKMLKTKKIC